MTDWLPLGTALLLGFLHALEVDHMVAVTAFVTTRPGLAPAAHFGARWGMGHSIAVVATGSLLLVTGLRLPDHLTAWGEVGVGLMLAGVGLWALRATTKVHAPTSDEQAIARPRGRRGVTLVGLLHGLAGTSAVIALVPVTLPSPALGFGYLVAFSLGLTSAMTLYALVAAHAMRKATAVSLAWGIRVAQFVAASAVIIGIWWVAAAL